MLIGDVQGWIDNFVSFDDRFLERIAAAWPECMAVLPEQPGEDDITINLVDRLAKDVVVRRLCHWVEYQFEPFGLAADGSKYSKGIIDIAILFDWDRERYLAYECKRLGGATCRQTQNGTQIIHQYLNPHASAMRKKVRNAGPVRSLRSVALATDAIAMMPCSFHGKYVHFLNISQG